MKDIVALLRQWDVEIDSRLPVSGAHSGTTVVLDKDGRRFVLKRKAGNLDVPLEMNLLTHLAAHGLPVAPPLPAIDGTYSMLWENSSYCLYPYLPGQVYDQHYNQEDGVDATILVRVAAYGRGLARLHLGLATLPNPCDYPVMDLPAQLCRWVRPTLTDVAPGLCEVDQAFGLLEGSFFARFGELPEQAIHRDAHPGNMLLQAGEVSGFVDFEIATRGPRLFDLGYCSTSLLAAAEDRSVRRQAWLDLVAELVRSYSRVQELSQTETELLGQMQMAIQLIFAAYYADAGMPAQTASNLDALQWLVANQDAVSAAIGRAR